MTAVYKNDSAGFIKWSIRDALTDELLFSGSRFLAEGDVKVIRKEIQFYKRIDLEGGFHFGLSEKGDHDTREQTCFGLSARCESVMSFSWNWFEEDSAGHAVQNRDLGELAFSTRKTKNGTEIARTDFLTDVTFEVSRLDGDVGKKAWILTIAKGSGIDWPTLEDGLSMEYANN